MNCMQTAVFSETHALEQQSISKLCIPVNVSGEFEIIFFLRFIYLFIHPDNRGFPGTRKMEGKEEPLSTQFMRESDVRG